jgi:hypothetical protein
VSLSDVLVKLLHAWHEFDADASEGFPQHGDALLRQAIEWLGGQVWYAPTYDWTPDNVRKAYAGVLAGQPMPPTIVGADGDLIALYSECRLLI